MKWTMGAMAVGTLLSGILLAAPANAAGCLKGAVVGGTAGHFAGHHGLLGAGAGCLVGRHEANKKAPQQTANNGGSGSSTNNSDQGR
jgi:hypothetical protein